MFLYTSFTGSEGYFCSLLISNIFLSTSHSTDFSSSNFLIFNSITLSTVINHSRKARPFMHQNLFINFWKTLRSVLKILDNFQFADIYLYKNLNYFVCAACYTSLLIFKTKLCSSFKNLYDLPVHWNHRFLSVSII